jgi:minor extracellular serine protease Vpr
MVRKAVGLLLVMLLIAPAAAFAAPAQGSGDYVLVTLKSMPLASYQGGVAGLRATKPARGKLDASSPAYRAYERHLANEQANYRAFLKKNAPAAQVVREYKAVLNGFAIKLNGADRAALARHERVKVVGDSWLYKPTMNRSVDLIKAAAGWGGNRATAGAGTKIGIIDSGIDDSHDFFACKDNIPHKVYASGKAGNTSDVLVEDHGTHVAGTAAGCLITLTNGPITGPISGVAPGAALYDYNVFPGFGAGWVAFGGSAFSHDIAAALEDAVVDGMDVVNMSLGGRIQGPRDFLAEASNATVDAGVVVATSAGNEGPGAGTIGSPGNAEKVIASGASTNPHFIGISVTGTTSGGAAFSYGAALGDFPNFDPAVTAPYTVTMPANGCSAISTDLTGKIALIDRGACTFAAKVSAAAARGAVGVLIVNNVAGDPTAPGGTGTIPAAMLGMDEGNAMKPSGTVTVDGTDPSEVVTDNEDIIAGFSSRGPASFLYNIKPDVTAPGVNIYSSVFDNEFAMFNGTSMASPHTAGAAALLLADRPNLTPADVKSLLVNNADRPVYDHQTGTQPTGVMTRGGGRINVQRAIGANATFAPASLSFGRHNGSRQVNVSIQVTVRNLTNAGQAYTISESDSQLSVSPSSLTVPGGGTGTFTVSLSARGSTGNVGGDVTVSGGGGTYLLPYWYSVGNTSR